MSTVRDLVPARLGGALACAAALLTLAACSGHGITRVLHENSCNKPQPYQRAKSIPPLKVPLGVDPPDTRGALRVPAYNEPAPPPRKLTAPCLSEPPSFVISGHTGTTAAQGSGTSTDSTRS